MPIARIKLPDGRVVRVKVDEGTTPDQALEFVKQNVDRFPQSQQQNPEQFDLSDRTPEAVSQRRSELGREIGLGARGVLQGAGNIAALPVDLLGLGVNFAAGKEIIPPVSGIVSEGLTTLGFPEPKTASERVASAAVEGATGAAGLVKASIKAGAPKLLQAIAGRGSAGQAAAAGGGAGLGAGAAAESKNPVINSVLGQLGVSVLGGIVGGRAVKSLKPKIKPQQNLLGDVAERGLDEMEAFTSVRSGLVKEATKQNKKITRLFDDAKTRGANAFIEGDDLKKLSSKLLGDIDDVIDIDGKNFLSSTSKTLDTLSEGKDISNTINKLQSFRRQASQIVRKDKAGSEGAKKILEKIDNFLDTTEIKGDPNAAKVWKDAIKARREFGQKFENPAKIAKAIDEAATIDTVEKQFLGTGAVSAQKDLARTYDEVLKALPLDKRKQAGFALRQSTFNQLLKNSAKSSDSAEGISASRLSNSIRNVRRENKSLWDKFPAEEKQILSKLERELRAVSKGGTLNRVYAATEKLISRGVRSNVELPRMLKAKTIVSIDDLLELSSFRPKQSFITPTIATGQVLKEQQKE